MCIFRYGKHIVSINRKKDSQLISLNSLLPCLHMSLEDSVLIWLLKQARTQLQSFCLWAVQVLLMLWGPRSVYTVKLCRHVILMSTKAKSYDINHNILKVKACITNRVWLHFGFEICVCECVCAHTHSRLISIQLVVVNCVDNFVSVLSEISNENRKLISAVLGIFVSQGINGGECMDILSV